MSVDRNKLEAMLKWYKQEVGKNLIAAIIVNREGFVMSAVKGESEAEIEEDVIAGVSALVEPVLTRITEEFSSGAFGTGTFDTEEHRIIFCEAGPEAIFVTVLDSIAMVDPIFPYAYLAAEKIARIFDGRTVSPVIPKFIEDLSIQNIERKIDKLQKIKVESGEYAYKLILGGEGGVGKTSMVHRFVENSFLTDYKSTIGTSIMKKECEFEGLNSKVRFVMWDLAGQAQFKRVRQSYISNAEAGILVYDVTRKDTFNSVESWQKEIQSVSPTISLILIGNKIDLTEDRVVSTEEGEEIAKKLNLSYIETSAKTGENINYAFKMLALQLIKKYIFTEEV
ncbi:MAG: GTP-binding protein [Candidatus Lokiarchaeota archaeon]|nr:GTP-binding protein [Candidatus Lokiarchaeota archaeon]